MYMKDIFAWFIYMSFSLSFKFRQSIIKGTLMQI